MEKRLDTFMELIESSIEYSQYVAMNHELQPGILSPSVSTKRKKKPLDVKLLQTILEDTKQIRNQNQRQQNQQQQPTLLP
jgi:hypothetical protein